MEVCQLRTNLFNQPLGVDTSSPEFSWKISTANPETTQSAYAIILASDPTFSEGSVLWKTAKVTSNNQFGVLYSGNPLQSFSRYYWKVRVWNEDGIPCEWSTNAFFETGVLNDSEWRARWITAPLDHVRNDQHVYFCTQIQLPSPVSYGRAFFSALGWYRLFINGHDLTGDALVPRWTPFDYIVEYQAYDVTPRLKSGTNHIGVAVGDGRFRGSLGLFDGRERYGNRLAIFGQLEVTTESGKHISFATDETWRSGLGPILSSDPQLGEHWDLRISNDEWLGQTAPEPDVSKLGKVELVQSTSRELVAESVERVQCVERLPAQQVFITPSGKQIVDFGQNFAGWIRIKLEGPSGCRVLLTFSEVLTKDGELNTNYLCPPLRIPPQQNSVILAGEQIWFETWFTIHGFRYVEIQGLDYTVDPADVEGKVVHSSLSRTGAFTCSNPDLERIYRNLSWSVRSNLTDTPTDCPTRERSGWTGDIQVFAPTATMFYDCQAFLRHFMRSVALEQLPNGTIPPYIPSQSSSFSGGLSWHWRAAAHSTGWGDVAVILPWDMYRYYGDERILHAQYTSMRRWVDHLETSACTKQSWRRWLFGGVGELEKYILDIGYHWGEWLRPGEDPGVSILHQILVGTPSISTAYLAHSSRILSKVARVLGVDGDAEHYEKLADTTSLAWNAAFVRHSVSGIRIGCDKQDEYVRALAFDLIESEHKPAAVARLVELIEQAGCHLATGFLSTAMLLPVLTSNGRADVAFRLLLQDTKPSWLGLLEKGATTLWETWEGYDGRGNANCSHNHYALGAFGIWLEEHLAGLSPVEPGFRRIRVAPVIGGGFAYASAERDTPFGLARSSWKLVRDVVVQLEVTIPPGATAEVHLGHELKEIGSGVYDFEWTLQP